MSVPSSKAGRHARIVELLEQREVRSQGELAYLLAAEHVQVTQATLSRDLVELGALRVRGRGGHLVYAVPREGGDRSPVTGEQPVFEARLARVCAEVLVSAEASANVVVLRTPPGAAQYCASAIDKAGWPSVLGTIAGDDTILVISRSAEGGSALAEQFLSLVRAGRPAAARSDRGAPPTIDIRLGPVSGTATEEEETT